MGELMKENLDLINIVNPLTKGLSVDNIDDRTSTLKEMTDYIQGAFFAEAKELSWSEGYTWESYLTRNSLTKSTVSRKIKFYDAKNTVSEHPTGGTLPESELKLPKSASLYEVLDGDSAVEKAESYAEAQEMFDKEEPTREELRQHKKSKQPEKDKPISDDPNDIMKQVEDEFGEDFTELTGNGFAEGMSILTIGTRLHEFSSDWQDIKRIFQKAAHPDKGEENTTAINFVNFLNQLFKDEKRMSKNKTKAKAMEDRFNELRDETI